MGDLLRHVEAWRKALASTGDVGEDDLDELESHLMDEISDLRSRGLTEPEALLVATRRVGEAHELSREYFKSNVNKLWKRLAVPPDADRARRQVWITVGLAAAAALLSQIPYLFDGSYFGQGAQSWLKFASLWVVPSLIVYFAVRHGTGLRKALSVIAPYGVIQLFAILYPFPADSASEVLVALHLPFLSWLLLLPLAVGNSWRSIPGAVHYLRFSGEGFVYGVLLSLAGGTLVALTVAMFGFADINVEQVASEHFAIAGVFGIPVVAVVLADRKRHVVENFTPTLARIFVPLFAISIVAFLITIILTGTQPSGDRELLLVMNILLLLVVAMLFYDVSAREETDTRRVSDWANLALIASALVLDGVTLWAISSRLLEYGASPNRAAVFGLNVILLVHLVLLAITYFRYVARRARFRTIEALVVRMLPVYGVWLLIVVAVFPPVFGGA